MNCIYCLDTLPLNDDGLYQLSFENASALRQEKAARLRFRKDRNLSLGAAILLDYGLQAYHLREKQMVYGFSDRGKPFFANAPDIHFSLSHSGTKVIASFSDYEVGCDVERIRQADLSVAKRFFSPGEYAWILSKPTPLEQSDAFFRLWTWKESCMKLTGRGLSLLPEVLTDVLCDAENRMVQCADGTRCFLQEFDCLEGYRCAVCTEEQQESPVFSFLKLTNASNSWQI